MQVQIVKTIPPPPVACTGYTYSAWSACGTDGQQTRTVTGNTPSGCTGTPPTAAVLTQACTPPPPIELFTAPDGWQLNNIATDGISIIAAGGTDFVAAWSIAIAVDFNSDGSILWQMDNLPGKYGKTQATDDGIFAIRTDRDNITSTYSNVVEKIDKTTGAVTSSTVVGTIADPYGTTAPYLGSLAVGIDAVYVAGGNGDGSTIKISKLDLSLANETFLLPYNSSNLPDMEVNEDGGHFYSISSRSMDAYTFDGIYFGYSPAPGSAQFNNTRAKGNVMYVSGSQAGLAYLWIYDENNGGSQRSYPLGTGSAEGMTFGPDGEMYVAINNWVGPVRLDPVTGIVAWTGDTTGHSVAYLNGKIYLATGSNKIEVFDALTGNHLD